MGEGKPGLAQQRQLTRAKLAAEKAMATVNAEKDLLEIKMKNDREREKRREEREHRSVMNAKARQWADLGASSHENCVNRSQRRKVEVVQETAHPLEEAKRLEEQAQAMQRRAALLRAKAVSEEVAEISDE